jgi:large subunit ribosomal protein L24
MAAHLSQELASSRGAKSLPVRKGDTVRIMRGDNKGFEGKVSRIDLKRYRIFIEGLTREKVDGTNIFVGVHPSKVMIRNLNLDDKWRKGILERKKELEVPSKEEKPEEEALKPAKKPARAKAAKKKPAAKKKKEEAPAEEEKPSAKKKKAEKPQAEEKQAGKETKPKAAKKTPAKRKTAVSKKEGGT